MLQKTGIPFLFILITFSSLSAGAQLERHSLTWSQGEDLHIWIRKVNSRSLRNLPSETRLPVLLLFGGFESGAKVVDMVNLKEPVIIATVEYPYRAPDQLNWQGKLREIPKMKEAIHLMVPAIRELVRFLLARQDVDPAKISIAGGSFGSPFAIHAAVEIEEIQGLILIHGFADPLPVMAPLLSKELRKQMPTDLPLDSLVDTVARLTSQMLTRYIGYPNLEQQLSRLRPRQKALMIEAQEDEFIPPSASESLWRALSNSSAIARRETLSGKHILRKDHPNTLKVTSLIVDWMKRESLL